LSSGLFCIVCIYLYTYTRAEHAMPKSAAGSQSLPNPMHIVAASAASSHSTSNVVQTDGFLSNKGFKLAVPRLAVVVGSLAGVHSDVVSETAAAAVFDRPTI